MFSKVLQLGNEKVPEMDGGNGLHNMSVLKATELCTGRWLTHNLAHAQQRGYT